MTGIILGKIGQGKLWQYTEAAAMVSIGTAAYSIDDRKRLIPGLAYSAFSFFVGKAAYGVTRALLQRVALFSMTTDRFIGSAAAIVVASYAGYWFHKNYCEHKLQYIESLTITGASGILGALLREGVYKLLTMGLILKVVKSIPKIGP